MPNQFHGPVARGSSDRPCRLCNLHTPLRCLSQTLIAWGVVVALLCGGNWGRGEEHLASADLSAEAPRSLEVQIAAWIDDLDSSAFDTRREATRQLIAAGMPSAQPLAAALRTGSRERVMRGMHVLEQIAQSDASVARQAALESLKQIAATSELSIARNQAFQSIDRLRRKMQEKSIAALKELGAQAVFAEFGAVAPNLIFAINNRLELDENWRGTADDLEHLQYLVDLEELVFSGDQFGDAHLAKVKLAPRVRTLTLFHTSVSSNGIDELVDVDSIQQLRFRYTPIGNDAVAHLAKLKQVHSLQLYGTKVSAKQADVLRNLLAHATIEHHGGAFMGVGPGGLPPTSGGLVVGEVRPNSAAQRASITLGDVIQRVGESPVRSFEELREDMAKREAGTTVTVELQRAGQDKILEVTLLERPEDLFDPVSIQQIRAGIQVIPAPRIVPNVPIPRK